MRHLFSRVVGTAIILVLPASPILAGGLKGTMYNLPPAKTQILDERIGILVRDVEDNRVLQPLDDRGRPFPPAQFSGNLLIVNGPDYSFTLPARGGVGNSRVVNIQFFRSNT